MSKIFKKYKAGKWFILWAALWPDALRETMAGKDSPAIMVLIIWVYFLGFMGTITYFLLLAAQKLIA